MIRRRKKHKTVQTS